MFKLIVTAWMIVAPVHQPDNHQPVLVGYYNGVQQCAIAMNRARHQLPREFIIIKEECEQTLQRR
jgi:hypothetical protein